MGNSLQKLCFITTNQRKLAEAKLIFQDLALELENLSLSVPEIQGEPEDVIRHKVLEMAKLVPDKAFFVDDTSLCFDAWQGLPGVYINDFLLKVGTEGMYRMLLDFANKKAQAQAWIGLYVPGQAIEIFQGEVLGSIVAPRGKVDFGWDPIFLPEGYAETFAEMGVEGKSKMSHRYRALEKLKQYLKTKNSAHS